MRDVRNPENPAVTWRGSRSARRGSFELRGADVIEPGVASGVVIETVDIAGNGVVGNRDSQLAKECSASPRSRAVRPHLDVQADDPGS